MPCRDANPISSGLPCRGVAYSARPPFTQKPSHRRKYALETHPFPLLCCMLTLMAVAFAPSQVHQQASPRRRALVSRLQGTWQRSACLPRLRTKVPQGSASSFRGTRKTQREETLPKVTPLYLCVCAPISSIGPSRLPWPSGSSARTWPGNGSTNPQHRCGHHPQPAGERWPITSPDCWQRESSQRYPYRDAIRPISSLSPRLPTQEGKEWSLTSLPSTFT